MTECAFEHTHKIYRDGRFFDLAADPFEERPLEPASLQGSARDDDARLLTVLDRYRRAHGA